MDFAGWQMPIQYKYIIEEHVATRTRATLFDVSHMARIQLRGPGAEAFIDHLATRKIAGMGPGKIRYSLVCNESGGILDDILVYDLPDADETFLCVVNASNRPKILAWMESHRSGYDVAIDDQTMQTAMIAFQGPLAIELISQHLGSNLADLKYFHCRNAELGGKRILVSRTGYTGEDGCEIIAGNEDAVAIWELLAGHSEVSAAGLGARDTLRLEAAMPLYGHELSEEINPAQTDLGFAISLKDREFIGKAAIEDALSDSGRHVRIGLVLDGKRAAREGAELWVADQRVGQVTSGTFSPTLGQSIAMGYIQPEHAQVGLPISVDIRGKRIEATVTKLPFYKRQK